MEFALEHVFPIGHRYYDRILYDYREGSYYDAYRDVYLTYDEARFFIPTIP